MAREGADGSADRGEVAVDYNTLSALGWRALPRAGKQLEEVFAEGGRAEWNAVGGLLGGAVGRVGPR